jgi:hypothetical protein
MSQTNPFKHRRLFAWLGGPLLLGALLWSIWSHSLPSLIERGATRALILNLVGVPILLVGVGILLYGGYIFGRDTTHLFRSERYQKFYRIVKGNSTQRAARLARLENLRLLWQNWQTGLTWLAAGLSLFVIGHFLALA